MRWLVVLALVAWGCDDGGGGDPVADQGPDMEGGDAAVADMATQDAEPTDAGPMTPQQRIEAVPETEAWALPGLSAPVQVIRAEMSIPHIYAQNRADLGRALGFIVARDRYFVIDLQRRLGLGTLTELLGDLSLENDIEARMTGMRYVAERLLANMSPEMGAYIDAFAEGVNAYIEAVRQGEAKPPSELVIAKALLGAASEVDLMHPWDRRSIAAMVAVVMYQTTFETGDVGRQAAADRVDSAFAEGEVFQRELRQAGYRTDIWEDVTPFMESASAAGLGLETAEGLQPGPLPGGRRATRRPAAKRIARPMLTRLAEKMSAFEARIGRDHEEGFGSNAWAVAGSASADGAALVAGDGHLQLSVPALMYQVGLNTALAGGDIHQTGLLLTGLPVLAVGTNGKVAWSQVNPVFDITDWYREEIRLGPDGRPAESMYQGEWRPLVAVDEVYEIADVPALGSEGRTETWTRWTTFDGRFIVAIEGRDPEEAPPGEGEAIVNMQGQPVVPADVDGQPGVSAISFDYAAFDSTNYLDTLDKFGFAATVDDYREATRGLVGSALFSAVADSAGDVLFSSYQAVPCRGYLARDEDGRWLDGADPTQLLDGTSYGGFTLPMVDGRVDPGPGRDDPYACVVPFDSVPQAKSPARGYVHTANNDPGGLTHDGRLDDDPWYIGGPWFPTRAHTIARELEKAIDEGGADVARMSAIQGNDQSRLGEMFIDWLLEAIEAGRQAAEADGPLTPDLARLAMIYASDAEAFAEVAQRLEAWAEGGYHATSGVQTVYHQPDDADREFAVATMIFNAWLPRFISGVLDDEGISYRFSGSRDRIRALRKFLIGRGEDNPGQLASWFADTGESIFFDRLGTEEVERSSELMLEALAGALDFLRGDPEGAGEGGFGTADMSAWLWGLRHQARLESLLAGFLGPDSGFAAILRMFNITTAQVRLTEERLPRDDPRAGLTWFPRPGDNWGVDAANPGFSGTRFTHGNGPVMRMVIALKGDEVNGVNIVPGGQSALTDSPHFADQARLWLANETIPLRFSLDQVLQGATGREVLRPE